MGQTFVSKRWPLAYVCLTIALFSALRCPANELPAGVGVQRVEFECDQHQLVGTLYLPPGEGPFAVAVFVHGSGSADRTCGGYYRPVFATFLQEKVACLAWDKPGVGESTGEYRTQFNADRAKEVQGALAWLRKRPEIDPKRMGLWGVSQAGYIIPQVAVETPDISFVILVSPAHTSLLEVAKFTVSTKFVGTTIRLLGYSQQDAEEASAFIQSAFALLERRAPFAEFFGLMKEAQSKPWFKALHQTFGMFTAEDINEGFYDRLLREVTDDSKPNLEKMHCPILAIFGADDAQVDAKSGKTHYETAARNGHNTDVTIRVFPNADHTLRIFQDSKRVSAPGYHELMRQWVRQHTR